MFDIYGECGLEAGEDWTTLDLTNRLINDESVTVTVTATATRALMSESGTLKELMSKQDRLTEGL